MLPSLIGQYRILRKIGAGGMGLVFLGEHTLLGRRAAIKTLLPTVAANHEIVERFFNEARATSAIADPGVIQIFDFGYHVDGTAYIVMELLEGEALSARLDRLGKLKLGDALRFGRQIATSLAAAHERDIVHRDLKPENIFLVRDKEAQGGERTKIIDFGICKMGTGDPMLTEVGVMIGTPVYMSPEQCRGSGEVDPRSDLYAFGCLLFHLLTGRPPFIGEASGELIVAHLQEPPPSVLEFVPGLPLEVDALLQRCLAKAPEDRFPSMTALAAALGELMVHAESLGPSVTPPPATVPLGRGFRSVFDANLARAVAGDSRFGLTVAPSPPPPDNVVTASGLPPGEALRARMRFAPPSLSSFAGTIDDDDDFEPRPRRAGIRAALACVLVVGVTFGLILTPLVVGDDDDLVPSRPSPSAAMPVESPAPSATAEPPKPPPTQTPVAAAAESPPAAAESPPAAAESPRAAAESAAESPPAAAEPPPAVAESSHRAAEPRREVARPASKSSPPRSRAPDPDARSFASAATSSTSRSAGPVRSPELPAMAPMSAPPTPRPAPPPVALPPPAPAAPPPAARPPATSPPPSNEELYDAR